MVGKALEDKIAIIGAGIVGVSCALHLQNSGYDVVLIDRGEPGSGASFGNAGVLARSSVVPVATPGILHKAPGMWLRRDGPLFLRLSYLPKLMPWLVRYLAASKRETVEYISKNLAPLVTDSVDEHLNLAKGTKAARWIKQSPYLFAYRNRAAFEADGFGWRLRSQAGFPGEKLEGPALRQFEPVLSSDYQFGVVLKDHGYISNPGRYVHDLAQVFVQAGGRLVKANVTDINVSDSGVRLETDGTPITAQAVLLAAGAWSGALAAKFGVRVPLESERGYHIEFESAHPLPAMPILDTARKFVATPMDEGLRCAGLVEFGGLEASASRGPLELLMRGAHALFPGLEYKAKSEWLGHRPATSDSLPVLGKSPKHENIFFAYGHHHVGLTAGPKTGRVVAQQIAGLEPNIDMNAYRADRAVSSR